MYAAPANRARFRERLLVVLFVLRSREPGFLCGIVPAHTDRLTPVLIACFLANSVNSVEA